MLRFSGPDAGLYRLGDPLPFTGALEDCGDGFDWRAADPALRFWVEDEPIKVAVWAGGVWQEKEPLDVWPASGRVSLDRCYRHHSLVVRAVCRPLSFLAETGPWQGELHVLVKRPNTLGVTKVEARPGPRVVRFPDVEATGPVLARLEGWEANYLFVGEGDSVSSTGSGTVLTFDEKGIVYVPC